MNDAPEEPEKGHDTEKPDDLSHTENESHSTEVFHTNDEIPSDRRNVGFTFTGSVARKIKSVEFSFTPNMTPTIPKFVQPPTEAAVLSQLINMLYRGGPSSQEIIRAAANVFKSNKSAVAGELPPPNTKLVAKLVPRTTSPKSGSTRMRKAQMAMMPVNQMNMAPADADVCRPNEATPNADWKMKVRFINPRHPINRRYASWDEITEFGRWAWEAKERPTYIPDPVGVLQQACEEVSTIEPDSCPKEVLDEIGDDFSQFLMMPEISESIEEPEDPPQGRPNTDAFRRVVMKQCDSQPKYSLHYELEEIIGERDNSMHKLISECNSRYSRYVRSANEERYLPKSNVLELVSKTLWRDSGLTVELPSDDVNIPVKLKGRKIQKVKRKEPVQQMQGLIDLFNSTQDDQASYVAEALGIPAYRNMKRKIDMRKLREDMAASYKLKSH